ncbi:MAG: hypothetical protein EHM91_14615, partial [Planctomycetota bacterium]
MMGSLPISFRPFGGVGQILKGLLGTELAIIQAGACMRVRYTGAQASCKLLAATAGNTLNSKIGVLG